MSASCTVVRIEFGHFFDVHLVKCFLDEDWAQIVAANAQACAASHTVIGFDGGKRFCLGQFGLFLLYSRFQSSNSV